MKLRLLVLAGITATVPLLSTPAFAHGDRRGDNIVLVQQPYHWRDRWSNHNFHARHHLQPDVVYVQPAPRVVYLPFAPGYYPPPATVYYGAPLQVAPHAAGAPVNLGVVGGALAGAALGSAMVSGNARTAAIAVGAVTGAYIGGRLVQHY